ncbi:response regulator transcription factor [Mycolicibacterium hodleri]|uniref:LuxR family transcriptional regulator n=1 Tax=Mycolicibacterium hodleri TaxID=49897 RepID=A0A502EJI9_9MYCO|nr:LuxR C-terminal-related transcriptional regulator [Mycolicibacterium hodleri]TPG36491.1 LuxR family transcriptional regulator [Mycolicibacterium hodleri]
MTLSRFCMESDVTGVRLVEQAQSTVAAACDHLELPMREPPLGSVAELEDLRRRLEAVVVTEDRPDRSASASAQLIEVLRVQCAVLDEDLSRRAGALSEVRSALKELRGLSPSDMMQAAPVVLSQQMSFQRAMISKVRGSLWLPRHLHIDGAAADTESQRFLEYVDGAQFQLAVAPLETEMVRKRCGALVTSPTSDKRTFKAIVAVSGCFGYVATPIVVQGRVIGMLHADRPGGYGSPTADHLDQLEAFAECLSVAFESAVLEEKSALQRSEVSNLCARVDDLLDQVVGNDRPMRASEPGEGVRRSTQLQPDISTLTPREREIMEHVATGATNGQIARCLVISEGTVKSHLKHIAKKLRTPSRAAAVAVYSGLVAVGAGR